MSTSNVYCNPNPDMSNYGYIFCDKVKQGARYKRLYGHTEDKGEVERLMASDAAYVIDKSERKSVLDIVLREIQSKYVNSAGRILCNLFTNTDRGTTFSLDDDFHPRRFERMFVSEEFKVALKGFKASMELLKDGLISSPDEWNISLNKNTQTVIAGYVNIIMEEVARSAQEMRDYSRSVRTEGEVKKEVTSNAA